ncbi:hypothetical protein XENOCAPTIV_030130, partial [Xenoophorus captivus]
LKSELDSLRSSLGDVSHRCIRFFEEKPLSSSVPRLRSELSQAVDRTDKLHNLSAVYLDKLKAVEVLLQSLDEAESQVRKYESRLSEEDVVPADTAAIQNLRDQLGRWHAELSEQEHIFQALQVQVGQAKEAGAQLSKLHPDRSPELERYQERANQIAERWIEETTERQENAQPGQTDSRALSEQLAQQTALVLEIEQNQTKLDECQIYSKQYCTSVKFMDLRTHYTALVTLTTQHVKYISDALRRLEEEEVKRCFPLDNNLTVVRLAFMLKVSPFISSSVQKEVEEEKQARVSQVSELLGWVKGLQGRTGGPNAESSLAAQQVAHGSLTVKWYLKIAAEQVLHVFPL